MTEHQIQCALVKLLKLKAFPGVVWTTIGHGARMALSTAKKLKAAGVQAGVPDMLFWHDGECFALELKADKGRASPEQIVFQDRLRSAGVHTATAKGFDQARITLEAWGVLQR